MFSLMDRVQSGDFIRKLATRTEGRDGGVVVFLRGLGPRLSVLAISRRISQAICGNAAFTAGAQTTPSGGSLLTLPLLSQRLLRCAAY